MRNLTTLTGKSEIEIKAIYLSAIETLVGFGATNAQARKLTQQALKDTLGICN